MKRIDLSEEALERSMAELSDGLAQNLGVLADLFASWRRPDVARAVLESMLTSDRGTFQALLQLDLNDPLPDPSDPPVGDLPEYKGLLDFCGLVSEITERAIPGEYVNCWRLREDLSLEEVFRFVAIGRQCGLLVLQPHPGPTEPSRDKGLVIPEGPCLEALRAEGLVEYGPYCWVDGGIGLLVGPPSYMCAKPSA